jgi:hypothetical protein
MRLFSHSAISLFLGTGLSVAGAITTAACQGDDFDGCEASKTCDAQPAAGSGNASGDGGKAGADAAAKGGKSGASGAGASAGTGGSAGATGGTGSGGAGGTGNDNNSNGGSDGNDKEPDGMNNGGRDDDGEGGAGGDSDPEPEPEVDDVPPGIVEVFPPNGAVGVAEDEQIVITFDEPMDNVVTEAAFRSMQLPEEAVELYWRDNSRQLVIRPKDGLDYAHVTSPDGDAKTYVFTLAGTATDVAGNPLGTDRTYTFTTLRHVTHSLGVPRDAGRLAIEGEPDLRHRCSKEDSSLVVGDTVANQAIKALVSFQLGSLPEGIVAWGSVTLVMTLAVTRPSIYDDSRLGHLGVYDTMVPTDSFSWTSGAETFVATVASDADHVNVSPDVREAVVADYDDRVARGELSQFVLKFVNLTDEDEDETQTQTLCTSVALELEYWVP